MKNISRLFDFFGNVLHFGLEFSLWKMSNLFQKKLSSLVSHFPSINVFIFSHEKCVRFFTQFFVVVKKEKSRKRHLIVIDDIINIGLNIVKSTLFRYADIDVDGS